MNRRWWGYRNGRYSRCRGAGIFMWSGGRPIPLSANQVSEAEAQGMLALQMGLRPRSTLAAAMKVEM
jgi:hypothetical protein